MVYKDNLINIDNMGKLIEGRNLAEKVKDKIAKEIYNLKGPRPNLAIIMVGDRKDSEIYVSLKEKEAKKVGIDTHLYKCEKDINEQEIFNMIDCLNKDEQIDGILVQLPLPKGFDTDGIIQAIDPKKDVDFFHPDNLETLFKTCNHEHVMSPVYKSVLKMLESIDCELNDKSVCILANSDIFGKSLAKVLECKGAKVYVETVKNKGYEEKVLESDILITAIGKPHFIKKEMIKKDAIIIDVGTTKKGKEIIGDVDFEDVEQKVSYISPVPGGVGPMTVAYLFENCLELFKQKKK